MRVSCICVCHDKPELAQEAIESIVAQSHADWEAIIIDSGVLFDSGYYDQFPWKNDARVRLIRSPETAEMRRTKAMAPWCFNVALRRGWTTGELVVYLCDDDLFYPNAFETFVLYSQQHPDVQAMYASQDVGVIYPNGWHAITGERRAREVGGRSCNGRRMDCEVDYLQLCHRVDVLTRFTNDEYWPEAKSTEEHADGIFMERLGAIVPIHPIDVKVSQNRRTTRSLNIPFSQTDLLDCMTNGIPVLPGILNAQNERRYDKPLVTVSVTCDEAQSLPEVFAAIAGQSYSTLEVIVASPADALRVAKGEFFLPVTNHQLLMPHAVERLLARMQTNPRLAAVTCYTLGVAQHALQVSVKNVLGHAFFRTADLRAIAPVADSSVFFKLVNAGKLVDVLPEHLFWQADEPIQADLLKPFIKMDRAMAAEREMLWSAMAGYEKRLEEMAITNRHLEARLGLLRYRIANAVHSFLLRIPWLVRFLKWCFKPNKSETCSTARTTDHAVMSLPMAAKKASASL